MKIPVVVVDDHDVDRYLVKRYLGKSDHFGDLIEMHSGEMFLENFYGDTPPLDISDSPILVLMDINMPGRDGFETAEEAQKQMVAGKGPQSLIIMMFTSSDNDREKERAAEMDIIKGYISKPLHGEKIDYIRELYRAHL